jgi:hypothetical protein
MPFSMTTYFAGVGTVVGALALGFGGGIVLTNTAIKDTPAGPTRIERVMRSEPISGPQVVEAKAISMPSVDPAPTVKPALVPVPVVQPLPVVAEVPKESQPAKEVEQPKQVESAKQSEQKDAERKATTRMKQQPLEEQGEPAKPELAYGRVEEPHFNLFESLSAPLLDRASDVAPHDRRERR